MRKFLSFFLMSILISLFPTFALSSIAAKISEVVLMGVTITTPEVGFKELMSWLFKS